MGKKAKSRGKTSRKLQQRVSSSPLSPTHRKKDDPSVMDAKDPCQHYEKCSDAANRRLSEIHASSGDSMCEDCRDEPKVEGRVKGNKDTGRKKRLAVRSKPRSLSTTTAMWVCLECSHLGCGGDADISKPCGHARRHHKQVKHVLAARLDDPRVCWCFSCDSHVRVEIPEVADGESNKTTRVEDSVESGSVDQESQETEGGHAVRGLVNLGNTCFFNSIMQNLFAMDMMREHFLRVEDVWGPTSMALKKLYMETGSGLKCGKGIVNPKSFFGCICSKAPQFKGYQQQDSHELLRYLLDVLSTEEATSRRSSGGDRISQQPTLTFVDGLFGGQISSTICCVECGHTSVVCEPFLDLSLPVPSKKVITKKVGSMQSKKTKLPPSLRGRKGRERASIKDTGLGKLKGEKIDTMPNSGKHKAADPASSESVSNASSPADEQQAESTSSSGGSETRVEFAGSVDQTLDGTWMDFIAPVSKTSDAIKDAEDMGVSQCRDTGADPAEGMPSLEGSSGERVEVSPNGQDSGIILLPYKETASTSNWLDEMTGESQNPGNVDTGGNLVETKNAGASLSSGCGSAEEGFDGLGDLFAEPEVTSGHTTQPTVTEDPVATSWFSETPCESSEEIVDNAAGAPVSIDSCLACFTKPELLSGEYAWHCENCSAILQKRKLGKQTAEKNDGSEMLSIKSADDIASERDNARSSLNGLPVENSHAILENGKLDDSAEAKTTCSGSCVDAHAEANGNKKVLNITASVSIVENTCEYAKRNCSEGLPCPNVCQANCSMDSIENGSVPDSGGSKYFSCTSSVGEADRQFSCSNSDSASCCDNNLQDDACNMEALVESSKVSSDGMEEKSDSCGNGRLKESRKMRKKGRGVLPKVHNIEESETENLKVKRDATKRILIHKAPPILTINSDSASCCDNNLQDDACNMEALVESSKVSSDGMEEKSDSCGNGRLKESRKMRKKGRGVLPKVHNIEESETENLKVKRDATKRILIHKAPPILTIHLKRFGQDARGRLNKLNGHVSFQEILDLAPYMDQSCQGIENHRYRLVGIVEHSGNMRGGHYVAHVRGQRSRRKVGDDGGNITWFHASDAYVREASLSEVLRSEAYILFYERVVES